MVLTRLYVRIWQDNGLPLFMVLILHERRLQGHTERLRAYI